MYETRKCSGGVQARTVEGGMVQQPISFVIEGKEVDLTLPDAIKLHEGLTSAIAIVVRSEVAIGQTRFGGSPLPSKLPT